MLMKEGGCSQLWLWIIPTDFFKNVTAAPAVSTVPSPAVPVSSTANGTATSSVHTVASPAVPVSSTVSMHVAARSSFTPSNDLAGNYMGHCITQWLFPCNISQSTMDGRNGSNACVFIALNFYQKYRLNNTLLGEHLNGKWQAVLQEAIRAGNEIHDELFDGEGVMVDDAIVAAGDLCQVDKLYQEFNVFGTNPLDQLSIIVNSLLQQRPSFHVLVFNEMADLIIVMQYGNWSNRPFSKLS